MIISYSTSARGIIILLKKPQNIKNLIKIEIRTPQKLMRVLSTVLEDEIMALLKTGLLDHWVMSH